MELSEPGVVFVDSLACKWVPSWQLAVGFYEGILLYISLVPKVYSILSTNLYLLWKRTITCPIKAHFIIVCTLYYINFKYHLRMMFRSF